MDQEIVCSYRQLKIKKGRILLKMTAPVPADTVAELCLIRYQNTFLKDIIYRIPVKKKQSGSKCIVEAAISLKDLELDVPEWKICCRIYKKGKKIFVPCRVTNKFMRKGFYLKDRSLRYTGNNGEICFLLLTSDYGVNLVHRKHSPYDDLRYRWKECAAKILYSMTRWYWNRKKIWIFFEKECRTAQDNGYYFFKYCISDPVKKEIPADMYYILDVSSPQGAEILNDPDIRTQLLKFYSWRYMMYLQAADLLISSESREQAVVWRNRNSFLRDMLPEKPLFFLQHGVIGLKRLPHFHKDRECGCSLFITSSLYEQDLVVRYLGYRPEETAVTGLARYDLLIDKSDETDHPLILVMPTWREWLDDISEESFLQSDFYRMYRDLSADRRLKELLENTQTEMHICLHPKAQSYGECFRSECKNIRVLSYDQIRLNEELMNARLLITDYSSVAWDMLYLGKPTVFFQFDVENYLNVHGSYLNFEKDLFGRQVKDIDSLVDTLGIYQEKGYAMEKQYEKMKDYYFAYHDTQNRKRIFSVLKKYWENQRKGR